LIEKGYTTFEWLNELFFIIMEKKIGLHIVGGLGDVCLTRKYSAIYGTDLIGKFDVLSIADVYDEEQIKNETEIRDLFKFIRASKIKGNFDENIEITLRQFLLNSIDYFQLEEDNPVLPNRFFENVNKNDIIDISIPNKFHLRLVEQVLKKHGHLIIEKPVVHSLDDIMQLESSLRNTNLEGRKIMDAEHYSHYGNIREYIRNFKLISKDEKYGFGLGKINKIELAIEEREDFGSERNSGIIEIEKSGGGIWLDTGIHSIAFLRNIGAKIDLSSVGAQPYKSHDERIQEGKYGETGIEVSFNVEQGEFFSSECRVDISVAKCCQLHNKRFVMHYENGRVEIDISKKSTNGFNKKGDSIFDCCIPGDAFYHVFDDMRKSIVHDEEPLTSIDKAICNLKDIFLIYGRAKELIKLEYGKHKFSGFPNVEELMIK